MSKVDCEITFLEGGQFGHFANAFRVVDEVGSDCYLDFLMYNYQDNKAIIVSRIKVAKDFIVSIRSRLEETMVEFSQKYPEHYLSKETFIPVQTEILKITLGEPLVNIFKIPKDRN